MAYLGVQPLKGQNRTIDNISASFNGSNVTFNLTSGSFSLTPATAYQLFISVGGVLQSPGVDFTVSGNQITFTTAPAAGLSFWGLYQGDAIDSVSVSDGSITTAKLATGLTVTLGAGAVGTPSLTFAGDTNTGIYSPAADTIAFVEGGVEALRIDSSARVGIGTSSPAGTLHVNGQTYIQGTVSGGQANSTLIANSSGQAQFWALGADTSTTGSMAFVVARSNLSSSLQAVTIDSSGRVGIGVTSPGALLHAAGKIRFGSNTTYYGEIDHDAASTGANIYDHSDSGGHIFRNGGQEALRIDGSKRLLVGTSTSLGNGIAQFRANTDSSTGEGVILLAKGDAATAGQSLGQIKFINSTGNQAAWITGEADTGWGGSGSADYPGRLVFSTTADGASSPTERMRIRNGGDTGIFCDANSDVLYLSATAAAGTSRYLLIGKHSATGTITSGTISLLVFTNGNIQNTNNSYAGISDIKLKENIVDATSQWDDIKALQVRKYNFKEGQTHTQIGLIAQEVELVSPGLVSESPDRDAEGNDLGTVTKSVNYSVLYMKAVKALQEAMERIETLEARLDAANL